MAERRIFIDLPEDLLAEVVRAAKAEHRTRNEFIRVALCDRISRSNFASSLQQLRAQAQNEYSEAEIDADISAALKEVREIRMIDTRRRLPVTE